MSAKHAFICNGGPFDGGKILLSRDDDQKTLVFTAKGMRGRYCGLVLPAGTAKNRKPAPATWEAINV